ncbi:hypothetical protein FOZ60_014960, partial [Perkinsus olseni]
MLRPFDGMRSLLVRGMLSARIFKKLARNSGDLESEIRTKHRICTDMTLKLRGPQDCRSPPRRGIEKDPCQGVIDEVATLDARVNEWDLCLSQ